MPIMYDTIKKVLTYVIQPFSGREREKKPKIGY